MNKVPEVFLKHIRESIQNIETSTKDVAQKSFLEYTNKEKQDAIVGRIEIIGEAVRNLPEDFKQNHPEIEWQKIAGMRNKIVHEYFGVDLELVWEVVENYLPPLKKQIEELLMEPA